MMSQKGSETDEVAPRYVLEPITAFFGHRTGDFTDDLQQTFQRKLAHLVGAKNRLAIGNDRGCQSSRVQDVLNALVVAPAHDPLNVKRLVENMLIAGLQPACRHHIDVPSQEFFQLPSEMKDVKE